jgi:hypothetical protein
MTPSPDTVINYVEAAVETLFEKDKPLLVNDSNERSITHRLAIYLEQEIKDLEPNYVVDVEYNRVTETNGPTDSIKKRVSYHELTASCRGRKIEDDDTDAQTVFPDVIVHKRNSSDHNLVVIEVKKTSSTESGDCDKEKIVRFRKDLGYKYGIFLQLRTDGEPEVTEFDLFTD